MSSGRPIAPVAGDPRHRRPAGADDATVEAVGGLSEAVEWLERARGCLYDFHQMIGHVDDQMVEVVASFERSGHPWAAELVDREVVGRNVLDGRWTFQIVEEFEELYYEPIKRVEQRVRTELMDGRRHVYEAELKERRRTVGRAGHEHRPPAAHDDAVATDPRA